MPRRKICWRRLGEGKPKPITESRVMAAGMGSAGRCVVKLTHRETVGNGNEINRARRRCDTELFIRAPLRGALACGARKGFSSFLPGIYASARVARLGSHAAIASRPWRDWCDLEFKDYIWQNPVKRFLARTAEEHTA